MARQTNKPTHSLLIVLNTDNNDLTHAGGQGWSVLTDDSARRQGPGVSVWCQDQEPGCCESPGAGADITWWTNQRPVSWAGDQSKAGLRCWCHLTGIALEIRQGLRLSWGWPWAEAGMWGRLRASHWSVVTSPGLWLAETGTSGGGRMEAAQVWPMVTMSLPPLLWVTMTEPLQLGGMYQHPDTRS